MWQHDVEDYDSSEIAEPFADFVAPPNRTQAPVAERPERADTSWNWLVDPLEVWPPPPRTLEETGLNSTFLEELLLKQLYFAGASTTDHVCTRMGLPYSIVDEVLTELKIENLVEIGSASHLNEISYRYKLTARGEERADDALSRSRYAGVAPVSLEEYTAVVRRQSLRNSPPSPGRILAALSELVLSQATIDGLARALHSGRSTLIFGGSGNGKTSILEHFSESTTDPIIIPHSLFIHGQLIRIFDAAVHSPLDVALENEDRLGLFKNRAHVNRFDQRWLLVQRPVVIVGGELTQESMELSFDPMGRFYQAPPHLRAQDGIFIVDDFGRQRVRPEELLNRWIVPMERGSDLLTLHTGESFTVPFEIALMFSTNLRPADLIDEAFLRRIPYKVEIPSPNREQFREITRRVAASRRLDCTEEQIQTFVDMVFAIPDREPKGAYPRDLIQIIMDSARFDGIEASLSPELIRRAISVYMIN